MPRRKKKYENVVEFPAATTSPTVSLKRWMNVHEAAKYLGVSTWQIRHLVKTGDIPHVTIGGKGKIILDQRDLDEYMSNNKTRAA